MDQIPDCVKIQLYGESHESFVFAILYNFGFTHAAVRKHSSG